MNAKSMWEQYSRLNNVDAEYDAWCFGDDADQLAALVLEGTKTATSSAYPVYALEWEALPQAGQYSVIQWQNEEAACVVKTTNVYVVPFRDVSAEHAFREGEGDRSLAYWKKVHEDFFSRELSDCGLAFTEDMQVVCEEFIRVYP